MKKLISFSLGLFLLVQAVPAQALTPVPPLVYNSSTGGYQNILSTQQLILEAPILGSATATSINGNFFTAGTYTLTGSAGKTLTFTNSLTLTGTDSTTLTFPGTSDTIPGLAQKEVWSGSQRVTVQTITISTATFTPNFDTGGDFTIGMTSACPCTLANPSTTPVAGQHGVIYVTQDGSGSRTFGTYGSDYISAGGTSTIALSTAANAVDVFSYAVKDSTHIVLSLGAANVSH